jgi:hypothetical protein
MSDNERDAEQTDEIHPVLGRMGTSADPAFGEALRERAENYPHDVEPVWKPRAHDMRRGDTTGSGPVPPGDRLAHLGRIEHPTEMWPMLTTFAPKPNPRADEEFEPWVEQFIKGAQDGDES